MKKIILLNFVFLLSITSCLGDNILKKLLIEEKCSNVDIKKRNKNGGTALHTIVLNKYPNCDILTLIQMGSDINAQDNKGNTPLHTAITFCNLSAAQILISNGANVNLKNNFGRIPLHDVPWLVCLREPNMSDLKKIEAIDLLVKNNSNINAKDNKGRTLLHALVVFSNFDLIKHFLLKKPNINSIDSNGASPLHYAASSGIYPLIEILLKNGANINLKDNNGKTALDYAKNKIEKEKNNFNYKKVIEILSKNNTK